MPPSSPSRSSLPAFAGTGLFLLPALLRCGSLGSDLFSRLFLPLCLLLCFSLGVHLLQREGLWDTERSGQLLLPLLALALFLRTAALPHSTLDYQDFLSHWVEHFRQRGLAGLADPVGNYNVPYLYFLCLISFLPVNDLNLIKFISIAFDLLLAWGGVRLTKALGGDREQGRAAFLALLFLPTVILNGSCWGQCDSIWAALCIHALACALLGEEDRSALLIGLAFSFKLQSIFLIPLWGALWLLGRIHLRALWKAPAACLATALPALVAGRSLSSILGVYLGQASSSAAGSSLNYNSPSIFTLLPYQTETPAWTATAAIALTGLFTLAVLLSLILVGREWVSNATLALAGTALSLGIPFLLPYMHERYFYLGGALLVILAALSPTFFPAAVAGELASLGGYHAYLLKKYALVLTFAGHTWTQLGEGLCLLLALVWVLTTFALSLHRDRVRDNTSKSLPPF